MTVYILQVRQAEDEPWKIYRVYSNQYDADQVGKSLTKYAVRYPKYVVTEHAVR